MRTCLEKVLESRPNIRELHYVDRMDKVGFNMQKVWCGGNSSANASYFSKEQIGCQKLPDFWFLARNYNIKHPEKPLRVQFGSDACPMNSKRYANIPYPSGLSISNFSICVDGYESGFDDPVAYINLRQGPNIGLIISKARELNLLELRCKLRSGCITVQWDEGHSAVVMLKIQGEVFPFLNVQELVKSHLPSLRKLSVICDMKWRPQLNIRAGFQGFLNRLRVGGSLKEAEIITDGEQLQFFKLRCPASHHNLPSVPNAYALYVLGELQCRKCK